MNRKRNKYMLNNNSSHVSPRQDSRYSNKMFQIHVGVSSGVNLVWKLGGCACWNCLNDLLLRLYKKNFYLNKKDFCLSVLVYTQLSCFVYKSVYFCKVTNLDSFLMSYIFTLNNLILFREHPTTHTTPPTAHLWPLLSLYDTPTTTHDPTITKCGGHDTPNPRMDAYGSQINKTII